MASYCHLVPKWCSTLCNPTDVASQALWDSLGKNTGANCHFLLQGIFSKSKINPRPLHQQGDFFLPLNPQASPRRLARAVKSPAFAQKTERSFSQAPVYGSPSFWQNWAIKPQVMGFEPDTCRQFSETYYAFRSLSIKSSFFFFFFLQNMMAVLFL